MYINTQFFLVCECLTLFGVFVIDYVIVISLD